MICQSTIRRFDAATGPSLHTAVIPQGAIALQFVALVVLRKVTGRYAARRSAPALTVAWAPREVVADETSTPAIIDAALASPDHVPLVVLRAQQTSNLYESNFGAGFPIVAIKGTAMALLIRIERIARGTHGQVTLGWEFSSC
jgi:hypothetical protein